jgi:hypothetical protein
VGPSAHESSLRVDLDVPAKSGSIGRLGNNMGGQLGHGNLQYGLCHRCPEVSHAVRGGITKSRAPVVVFHPGALRPRSLRFCKASRLQTDDMAGSTVVGSG